MKTKVVSNQAVEFYQHVYSCKAILKVDTKLRPEICEIAKQTFHQIAVDFQAHHLSSFKRFFYQLNPHLFFFFFKRDALDFLFCQFERQQLINQRGINLASTCESRQSVLLYALDSSHTLALSKRMISRLTPNAFYRALKEILLQHPQCQTVRLEEIGEIKVDDLKQIVQQSIRPHPLNLIRTLQICRQLNISLYDRRSISPLFLSILMQREDTCKDLLKSQSVHTRDAQGRSVLHYASAVGNSRIFQLLLKHGAHIQVKDSSLFFTVLGNNKTQKQKLSLFKLLVQHGACLSTVSHESLALMQAALRQKHYQLARYLIEINPQCLIQDLQQAHALTCQLIEQGQVSLLRLCQAKGVRVNHVQYLSLAIQKGQSAVLNYLLEINRQNPFVETSLLFKHALTDPKKLWVVKALIKASTDLNHPCADNMSPLMWACENDNFKAVCALVRAGASLDRRFANRAALHVALHHKQWNTVKYLILRGASVESFIINQMTLLDWELGRACKKGDLVYARFLLEKGAQLQPKSVIHLKKMYSHDVKLKNLRISFKQDLVYSIDKEVLARKLIAHTYELKGTTHLKSSHAFYDLEGLVPPSNYAMKQILKHLQRLYRIQWPFNEIPYTQLSRALEIYLSYPSADQVLKLVNTQVPCVLETGFEGHNATLTICGNFLILCNRGSAQRNGRAFEIFKLDGQHLNRQNLKRLIEMNQGSKEDYLVNLGQVEKAMNLKKDQQTLALEKLMQMPNQLVGNCCHASAEGALFALFVFQPEFIDQLNNNLPIGDLASHIAVQRVAFEKWQNSYRIDVLDRYLYKKITRHDLAEVGIDMQLIERAIHSLSQNMIGVDLISQLQKAASKVSAQNK